ncbi:C39 family peptidase [Luxibacter massiliensis]|uniref:C39 family peptidase n=1 Tax=Luxibacter massiliensis TaxID=2219695 RepID=UPI000F04812D|nr:C39 family peptidase [Luxibacter massiliensis]
MKKKRLMKAGVLAAVFLAAMIISSLITNRGTDDLTIDLGDPTLPRVSYTVAGKKVNILAGYVNDMDITAMRDTITPLEENGTLEMSVEANGNKIQEIQYEVYSLNGEEVYDKSEIKDLSQEAFKLDLNGALKENVSEAVLKVILKTEKKEVYFYTRVERPDDLAIGECLSFAEDFHAKTFDKGSAAELSGYLEPNEEGDNTTFQTVTIHSSSSQVTWGELKPEISTDVEWSIKESNSVYTSLQAKYQVTCVGEENEIDTYNIKEFFRVRYSGGEVYLLDYNRSMNQVFNGNKKVLNENGILLGIAPSDISYETSKDGTIVSFVHERDLWTYNQEADELSLVFSFANTEGHDVRSRYDQHELRIISMDDNGSTTFAVYGYMNRGDHEGEVGVDVYYFDIDKNAVEEKAFIPSNKSFAIAEDELGKMVYYNHGDQLLYVLAGGTLYQADLESNHQNILARDLEEGQYAASNDGHLLAYQTEGSLESAKSVTVLNLKTGEERIVEAAEGESIRPLGFVANDFVYGYQRASDKGKTVVGEDVLPMFELEIRDSKNKVVKTYSVEGTYISDILIENNLVTLNRLTKSGDVYTGTSQDYISNNEERRESNITLESYTTELKEKQMRLTYTDGIPDQSPKLLRPKQVMLNKPMTIAFDGKVKTDKFYVYGMGELIEIYDKAAYAIQKAEQVSGVVISSEQSYIWEKGNRDLVYYTDMQAFKKGDGQTSIEACEVQMEQYGAKRVDLTGCSLDQVLYVINKGLPVIAMTDSSHAILMTGYTTTDVTYINPDDGSQNTVSLTDMEAMAGGSGNTFIGFVK